SSPRWPAALWPGSIRGYSDDRSARGRRSYVKRRRPWRRRRYWLAASLARRYSTCTFPLDFNEWCGFLTIPLATLRQRPCTSIPAGLFQLWYAHGCAPRATSRRPSSRARSSMADSRRLLRSRFHARAVTIRARPASTSSWGQGRAHTATSAVLDGTGAAPPSKG